MSIDCFYVSSVNCLSALGCHSGFKPTGDDVKKIHQVAADSKVETLTEAIISGPLGSSASTDREDALRALWNTFNAEGCRWAYFFYRGGGASSATLSKKAYVDALVAGHFPFLDYDVLTLAFSRLRGCAPWPFS
jgi:hypothetical protein